MVLKNKISPSVIGGGGGGLDGALGGAPVGIRASLVPRAAK